MYSGLVRIRSGNWGREQTFANAELFCIFLATSAAPPGKGYLNRVIAGVARNRGWHSSRLLDAWCERSFGVRTMWLLCFDRRRSGRQHLQQENAAQALTADSNFASRDVNNLTFFLNEESQN